MNVCFDNLEDFQTELRSTRPDIRNRIIVRGEIQKLTVQRGTDDFTVILGYHDETYFYEARIPCGQDYSGAAPEGSAQAEVCLSQARSLCNELGIAFRAGSYKWT